ncbi:helix-turn-helix domain-containing protein [Actinotalea ferrariae]|uniref:helix-turn-helix domain-containing protein n=1 Tax=Actinotalea ferrariae TaxID=1386098 RepID=UPI001C8CBD1A|nr:helix-turn-helix domain-containing protein [Actinotalea ferrariae]MBX9244636.1 helix-turn-helix domain-containing protein [Actinotalea ferrariae]
MRTSRGTLDYRTRDERALTKALPSAPAAVRVYGPDGCCTALCLDLDASRGGADAVAADATRLTVWLERHGARYITDASPNGGVHIYVPFADRVPYDVARELVEALGATHPTLDAGPHRSVKTGCIRVPGSVHKRGGHQALTMPLAAAYDVARRPNPPAVLSTLREALSAEIAAWRTSQTPTWPQDATTPDTTARGQLSARLRSLAETGVYDTARYASPSEARQAVIAGAAAAGWALADVAARLGDGRWPGLAALYARYSPTQRHTALARDWHAAATFLATTREHPDNAPGASHVRRSHTSPSETHRGTPDQPAQMAEHDHIRTWRTLLRAVEQHRFPGRAGYLTRFVLRALGEAAHKTESRYVSFGTRSLAVAVGADHSTVAAVLRRLAGTPGGWIDLIEPARGENADLYELTVPTDLASMAADLRWDRGRGHALRPVFRALGPVAALVFEALEDDRAHSITTLAAATGIARSAVHEAIDTLIAHHLVERHDGRRLRARSGALLATAELLGVLEDVIAQMRRYALERQRWHAWLARHDQDHHSPADPDEDFWWPPDDSVADDWTLLEGRELTRGALSRVADAAKLAHIC